MALVQIRAEQPLERLTAPGSPFELREESVLGERMHVFAKRPRSLRDVLAASIEAGDAEYLVFADLRLSYREHFRRVAALARSLRNRYGVRPGDRVAILAANCPEWILAFWATTSLGAVAVGLNAWWTTDEIRFALEDCEPQLVIADDTRRARIDFPVALPILSLEEVSDACEGDAAMPEAAIDEDDPAAILYTSGTTGRAKGVVSTHRNVIAMCMLQILHGARVFMEAPPDPALLARLPAQRSALVANPLFHVSGLYTQVVTFLMTRAKTVWMTGRYDPVRAMQLIEREKITGWSPHGPMGPRLVSHPDVHKYDLSSVMSLGTGGAPVAAELQARLREVFPNTSRSMTVGYGLTECTALATLAYGDELITEPTCVGRPLPSVALEIRDGDGRALADGQEGEIHVRSPLVMKEYWRRPDATRETILRGRWLRTGDIGRLIDGKLYIASRKRDMILRGAENVHPAEIELRLAEHPSVAEAAVIGVDHPELGQEVMAIVVPRDGTSIDERALAAWVGEKLAYYKVPTRFAARTTPLPRNASGKVLKQNLLHEAARTFIEED